MTTVETSFQTEKTNDVLKIDNTVYSGTYGPCDRLEKYDMTYTSSYRIGWSSYSCSNYVGKKVLGAIGASMR